MGNHTSHRTAAAGLSLEQIERVYSLPGNQLVRLSQICSEQKRHETEVAQHVVEELPAATSWSISVQLANRMVLRVQGLAAVKDTWLVLRQEPGTIELCTAAWLMQQPKFPSLEYETSGRWFVSHTSLWGICLRCYGVGPTGTAANLWKIDSSSAHRIVLRTVQWYRDHPSAMSAHRKTPPAAPPTSPRM